ncbi:MAG TPA: AraC family transcriptional regulator [Rhodobacteraceae bacterium]|nr:AraC family transcriptional regulator [Paracoccaceae bacterium]
MSNPYETRILRVLAYIHDNPAGDMSLDRLAEVAAMSRFHWHRVFRAMTGETCASAVRRVRLHRAATMLIHGDAPIPRVAAICGYDNPDSFARAFARSFGSRPAEFRKSGRLLPPVSPHKPESYPMHAIQIRTEPARRLAVLPHAGAYENIGKSFESFLAICRTRALWPQIGAMIGVYFADPGTVPEAELTSLAGAEWLGRAIPEGMMEHHLPGGRTVVLTYKGPYSRIDAAYQTLFGDWLPNSGEEPADTPAYNILLNAPHDTAPQDLLTEICLPLK